MPRFGAWNRDGFTNLGGVQSSLSGTYVSGVVSSDGVKVTITWSVASTWGTLSIQAGKVGFLRYGLTETDILSISSQSDPSGEGSLAAVVFNIAAPVDVGTTVTFWADAAFLMDTFGNATPSSSGAAVTNNSAQNVEPGRLRSRDFRLWR